METYSEMKIRHQNEVNALPLGFAFSNEQFNEMMSRWGLDPDTDLDKIYAIGGGTFYRRSDSELIHDTFKRHEAERKALRKSMKEMKQAFIDEMYNHEYAINPQGDYDVLGCFGSVEWHDDNINAYFAELGFDQNMRKAYLDARKTYFKKLGYYGY